MPTHIYQRPLLDQPGVGSPISLVGTLPPYTLGEAYEGRLQILNSIGPHFVKQVGGDRLPNGSGLSIDEETSEVVLNWPALFNIPGSTTIYKAEIRNADFEGTKGWVYGEGWKVSTDAINGAHSAAFNDFYGTSITPHTSRFRVNEGRTITAMCNVRQGASAKRNVGARVLLQWRDDDDNIVLTSQGNLVDDASKGRVYQSKVTAAPPVGATQVNIAFEGIRSRENKALWVDDFAWDHVIIDVVEPVRPEEEYYLEIRVTDTLGRVADWAGYIYQLMVSVTGQLLPFVVHEELNISARSTSISYFERLPLVELTSLAAIPFGMEYKNIVSHAYTDVEQVSLAAVPYGMVFKNTAITRTVDPELTGISAVPFGIMTKTHPRVDAPIEATTISAIALGISYG